MPYSRSANKNQSEILNETDCVIVVAARSALGEYLKYSAYICQPRRTLRPFTRMAFYTSHKIDRYIPKIIGKPVEAISADEIETRTNLPDIERTRLRALFKKLDSARKADWSKNQYKIVFLTDFGSLDTIMLPHDIVNDLTSENGQRVAFTRRHRYVSLSRLEKGPNRTSELV